MDKNLKNVLIYTLLAYGFSWAAMSPFVLNSRGIIEFPFPGLLPVFGPLATFGPMAAAVLMMVLTEGRSSLTAWVKRCFSASFGIWWWVAAILLWPGFQAFGYVAGLLSGAELETPVILTTPWVLIPVFLQTFLIGGPLGEEMGWRGYALGQLQNRWSALTSSLVLGVIHACWHLPIWFVVGPGGRDMPFLLFATNVVTQTVIYTWLFNNSKGSLWPVMLFHTFQNMVLFNAFGSQVGFAAFAVVFLGGVVAIVLIFGPKRLVREKAA